MALYNNEQYRTIFTDIGKEVDTCIYCSLQIKDKRFNKKISTEDAILETKKLKGNLTNMRIAKFNASGNYICICEDCLMKILDEIHSSKVDDVNNNLIEEVIQETLKDENIKTNKKRSSKK